MKDSRQYYQRLPALESFQEAFQTSLHSPLPHDWWVVVADISNSTVAIENGEYKKVNTVGVACIAAMVNIDQSIQLPYVFGGDGAIFAIPEAILDQAKIALRGAQRLSKESFELELRVGLINAGELKRRGFSLNLAKIALSAQMSQACMSGDGWAEAERLVKTPGASGVALLEDIGTEPAIANFDGFECRWHSVKNFNGHKLSLLVSATSLDTNRNLKIYDDVLRQIYSIYGEVREHHPLRTPRMHLTMNPYLLSHEWRVRTLDGSLMEKFRYLTSILFKNLAGYYLFWRNKDTKTVRWSRYRDELVANTDFRKFDGMLRMVIDGSDEQYQQLNSYLEGLFKKSQIAYGMYRSKEALITCLVQSYSGSHVHFVDGSSGGYAMAAKELKQRLQQIKRGG